MTASGMLPGQYLFEGHGPAMPDAALVSRLVEYPGLAKHFSSPSASTIMQLGHVVLWKGHR